MNKPWWQSSTVTGAALAAVSAVAPFVIQSIPPKYGALGAVLGWAVSQIGMRTAVAKNGEGK